MAASTQSARVYPSFPLPLVEQPGLLKLVATLAWVVVAFSLAHLFYFFRHRPDLLDLFFEYGPSVAMPSDGDPVAWPPKYATRFVMMYGGFLAAAALYVGLFTARARRLATLTFGQALVALAPGLSGFLFYITFLFVGNHEFNGGAESYLIARLPIVLALVWPFFRFKLLRGTEPGSWREGSKMRIVWMLAATIVGALLVFNPLGHSLAKWRAFANNLPDMGLYTQMAWGWANGLPLYNTSYELTGDFFLHGEHALFFTAFFAPMAFLPDVPLGLLLLQSLALMLGGALTYRLARYYTALPWAPAVLTLMYFCNPLLERGWIDDVHIDAFEVPLVLALWLVAVGRRGAKRWVFFLLLSAAYISCKEDAGLTLGGLGLALMFRPGTRAIGAVALFMGPTATLLLMNEIAAQTGGETAHLGNYAHLGDSPGAMVITLITRPDIVLGELLQFGRRLSLVRLIFSTGLIVLLVPEALILCGAPIVTTLLSNWEPHFTLSHHYGFDFLGPLTIATIIGWGRLERLVAFMVQYVAPGHLADAEDPDAVTALRDESWSQYRSEFEWRMMLLAFAAIGLSYTAHAELAKHNAFHVGDWWADYSHVERFDVLHTRVMPRIAPTDGVATQNHLASPLAARDYIGWFPLPPWLRGPDGDATPDDRVTVILIDRHGEVGGRDAYDDLTRSINRQLDTGRWGIDLIDGDFLLLRRAHPAPTDEQRAELKAFLDGS